MDETKVTQPEVTDEVTNEENPFEEIDNEVIDELNGESENESESDEENQTEIDEEEKEEDVDDYKPFLDELSKKVKYNKETVQIESMDDVISNYQKGLNYDKLQEKLNNLENSKAMSYINTKANEMGLTVDEYMEQVEFYEKQKQKEQEKEKYEEMISNGVPEDIAKEVIATSQLRKELQEMKNEFNRKEEERKNKESKDKEYMDFVEEFPDVKAEDIPKDVFLNAKNSSLKEAYMKYQLEEQRKQLEILKNNEKNNSKSVGSTTEFGGKENKSKDAFLEGFDS